MSLRMMFSQLGRHGLIPVLVLLQIALACAILCNVLFLAWQRLQPMIAPSGVDEANLILVDNLSLREGGLDAGQVRGVEQALRQVPGVRAVSTALGLPMSSSMLMDMGLQAPDGRKIGVNAYWGEHLLGTLGLTLVAGRDFLPDEYRDWGLGYAGVQPPDGSPQPIIITRSLATQLFGDASPLGQVVAEPSDTTGKSRYRIVGVVAHLLRNQLGLASDGRADNTVLAAKRIAGGLMLSYAIRVDPAMRETAGAGVRRTLQGALGARLDADAPPRVEFYAERRARAFRGARAALWLFAGVIAAVVLVVVLGIMGLTGFWVQQRTRQIGIQRALGARRRDVLAHVLMENALVAWFGLLLGMGLALLGNRLLMSQYELPALPLRYLPVGALVMLLLGQLAALGPARRAASVSPMVATRSL